MAVSLSYVIMANLLCHLGFPGGSLGKESACSAGDPDSTLGWEDTLEKGMATHSSICAWRTLWTTVHRIAKSQTQLSH